MDAANTRKIDPISKVKLVYGIAKDGRTVHVSAVKSGLACDCTCPDCKTRLEAKKGNELQHHFAHDSVAECKNAPETALHKMAKQIIQDSRKLWIPAVIANISTGNVTLAVAKEIEFVDCELEETHSLIKPDATIRIQQNGTIPETRTLLVEIYVTHKCDHEKIEKIRHLGNSAIEIDLSTVARDIGPELLAEKVMQHAERKWLFNAKVENAQKQSIADEAKKSIIARQRQDEKVQRLLNSYKSPSKTKTAQSKFYENCPLELKNFSGVDFGGMGCFQTEHFLWQQFLLTEIAEHPNEARGLDSFELLHLLEHQGYVKPAFKFVKKEDFNELEKLETTFQRPLHTVEKFVDYMITNRVLQNEAKFRFRLSATITRQIADRQKSTESLKAKFKQLEEFFNSTTSYFDLEYEFETFCDTFLPWCNSTPSVMFTKGSADVDLLLTKFRSIVKMLVSGGPVVSDRLGLPIIEAMEKCRLKIEEAAKEAESAKQEALKQEAFLRVDSLVSEAKNALGEHAEAWISSFVLPDKDLFNMAYSGISGLDEAREILWQKNRDLRVKKDADDIAQQCRQTLQEYALKKIGDESKVSACLNSTYGETRPLKLFDYCRDSKKLEHCKKIIDETYKKLRKN